MITPLPETRLLGALDRFDDFRRSHEHVGVFACCTAHASAQDVPALVIEVARLRAERPGGSVADTLADFYQPGYTYSFEGEPDWAFRCDTITTHPDNGELAALGWRCFKGEWTPYAYHQDDWETAQYGGTLVAKAGGRDA